jgi:two-component system, cell cycle response regulator
MSTGSATVFVADDNPILLQGLERALAANGYAVETAGTGAALLRLLEEARTLPDLLLLDVMMPEMSGLDVLQRIHDDARWADVPVVLITAANDEQLPVSALKHGAVDFLTKPFRLGELLARVDAHVGRYRELRRARDDAQARMQAIAVVRDLNSVVTAEEMFRLVTSSVGSIWGVRNGRILIEAGEGDVRVAAAPESIDGVGTPVPLETHPELRAALEQGVPVLVEDVASSPLFAELSGEWWSAELQAVPRSVLAVPFQISRHVRGVFHLCAVDGEPRLGPGALALAQQVVDGMARALDRTQVLETLIEQRRQLHDLAHTDELTGCATRRAVLRYLAEELDLAQRREAPLAVVIFDLDRFKEINDSYGHSAGDSVLRTFGDWLHGEEAHRAKDCAGRLGGDEFLVILPDTTLEGALRFAERARDYLASVPFVFGGRPLRASLSAGIAAWPAASVETLDQLLEHADAALYAAKQGGRDRIQLARPDTEPPPAAP